MVTSFNKHFPQPNSYKTAHRWGQFTPPYINEYIFFQGFETDVEMFCDILNEYILKHQDFLFSILNALLYSEYC